MDLILRLILASVISLVGSMIFIHLGWLILLDTPFASTPLIDRLPGISNRFCPESASLVMERKNKNEIERSIGRYAPPPFKYRVLCLDSNGARVADVSNDVVLAVILGSAVVGYLIAWPVLFSWIERFLRNRSRREKWFNLGTIIVTLSLGAWAMIYITRQPTSHEMERAGMIALAGMIAYVAIFITAQRYFHKKYGPPDARTIERAAKRFQDNDRFAFRLTPSESSSPWLSSPSAATYITTRAG